MLTQEELKRAMPSNLRSSVSQTLVDTINNITVDPIVAENVKDNILSYANILKEGKFKTEDYVNAVTYVSYKLMGLSNSEAYEKTFPQRYNDLIARVVSKKDISSYVAAYHKGKLVNLIMEQSLVPSWIVNQENYQRAINVQVELMTSATSEKVRTDAANSLLTHLKKPETTGLKINLDLKENSGMSELKDSITRLAAQQKELIEGGMSAKLIAATPLIDMKANEE